MNILEKEILGNLLSQWSIAGIALVVTVFALMIIRRIIGSRLKSLAKQTDSRWEEIFATLITQTKLLFLLVVGTFVGSLFVELPTHVRPVFSSLLIVSLLVQTGIWGSSLIKILLESYRESAMEKNPGALTSINVIGLIGRFILWSSILLLALNNLGVNVTSLVAGLGIGGVAVALALQNILGDLFASLSIVLDKPFVNGDFLVIGEFMGSVEYIGLKSTRVRSLSGEQLVFSNSDLLSSRIRNYGRMFERRVVFSIGVTYQTPRDKLKRIPVIIKEAVQAQDNTRFDRSHFMKYGDYSLMFESVFYVKSADYNIYMDIQQAIYFDIHERFEQEDIEFAYPTQTLFVNKTDN